MWVKGKWDRGRGRCKAPLTTMLVGPPIGRGEGKGIWQEGLRWQAALRKVLEGLWGVSEPQLPVRGVPVLRDSPELVLHAHWPVTRWKALGSMASK